VRGGLSWFKNGKERLIVDNTGQEYRCYKGLGFLCVRKFCTLASKKITVNAEKQTLVMQTF